MVKILVATSLHPHFAVNCLDFPKPFGCVSLWEGVAGDLRIRIGMPMSIAPNPFATDLSEEEFSIAREPLAERIAERLREWILLEKLAPGSVITERALADKLGVSRTPMREALSILVNDGLIDASPNKRPRIANPSIEQISNLLDVQSALETLAGTLCVERATKAQLDRITAMLKHLHTVSATSDPLDFFRLDMAFHRAIVKATGNAPLIETHRQYNAALFRARFLSSRQMIWRDVTMQQHDDIGSALNDRDAGRAAKALGDHIMRTKQNIRMLLEAVNRR